MSIKLSMDNPAFPKDTPFDVGGVLVPNGGSTELDEDQERMFIASHGVDLKEHFADSEFIKVEGSSSLSKKDKDALLPPVAEEAPVTKEGGES